MSSTLDLTLVQTNLFWQDIDANLEHLNQIMGQIQSTDLIILPEMFSTGFSMASADYAESMKGRSVSWMKDFVRERNIPVCGSLMIRSGKEFYNRFIFAGCNGDYCQYDKKHLFRMSDEQENYNAGNKLVTFPLNGFKAPFGRVGLSVCYDLRFPVWTRNRSNYDLLVFVANWPAARRNHWLSLLQARAIENQAYVVGVNRIGVDGNDIEYTGDSVVYDFNGEKILDLGDEDTVANLVTKVNCKNTGSPFQHGGMLIPLA